MNLARSAINGLSWSALSETIIGFMQIIQLIVLARLLSSADFGLFAIVVAITAVVSVVADVGVSDAIIHRKATTDGELSSLYWLNVIVGFTLYGGVLISTVYLEALFGQEGLALLIAVGAAPLAITPLGHQFGILLQKALRFRTLNKIEMFAAFFTTVLSIILASVGAGVFALVWSQIAGAVFSALALFIACRGIWRPRLHFMGSQLKGYLNFGVYIVLQRVIETLAQQLDKILIGAFLGPGVLGGFYVAQRIADLPIARLSAIFMRVLFPVFAKRQDDLEYLRNSYLLGVRGLASIAFPIFLGLALIAPWLVPITFGPGWDEAVIFLQILAIANLFNVINVPAHPMVLARGGARLKFLWSITFSVLRIPCVIAGLLIGGAIGLAWGITLFRIIATIPFYFMMIRSQIDKCAKDIILQIYPSLLMSLCMSFAVFGFMSLSSDGSALSLAIAIVIGVATQAALMVLFERRNVRVFLNLASGAKDTE